MIADGAGRAIAFRIAPGQAHELPHAQLLLKRLPGVLRWVVADRGYSSHRFREQVRKAGAKPAIPSKCNEAPARCPDWIYTNRNIVERLAVATRYVKTATSFTGILCLVAALDHLR